MRVLYEVHLSIAACNHRRSTKGKSLRSVWGETIYPENPLRLLQRVALCRRLRHSAFKAQRQIAKRDLHRLRVPQHQTSPSVFIALCIVALQVSIIFVIVIIVIRMCAGHYRLARLCSRPKTVVPTRRAAVGLSYCRMHD